MEKIRYSIKHEAGSSRTFVWSNDTRSGIGIGRNVLPSHVRICIRAIDQPRRRLSRTGAGTCANQADWRKGWPWYQFSDATIPEEKHHALLIGFWPLIERFPQFLALNLLKCTYGEDTRLNKARGWLIKNLRVEQQHAEWYRDWAQCAGISPRNLYQGHRPAAATAITDWCWHVCESGGLAEGMAATNFAIEGVTGDWCELVWKSANYRGLFPESEQKKP